jgi:hydrogenase-4 membrane subunit HyfE
MLVKLITLVSLYAQLCGRLISIIIKFYRKQSGFLSIVKFMLNISTEKGFFIRFFDNYILQLVYTVTLFFTEAPKKKSGFRSTEQTVKKSVELYDF